MNGDLDELQGRLGYRFRRKELLEQALTHRSVLQDNPARTANNQRLEFLGDAVIQMVLSRALFDQYPGDREGQLSTRRAALARGPVLAGLARAIGLDGCLRLGSSEEAVGGRTRDAALEDAFEAVAGAIYVDAGMAEAERVVLAAFGDLSARLEASSSTDNPKGRLQEAVQAVHGNGALRYEVERTAGADHARSFEVCVFLNGVRLGAGTGSSKKQAEEQAAQAALDILKAGLSGG